MAEQRDVEAEHALASAGRTAAHYVATKCWPWEKAGGGFGGAVVGRGEPLAGALCVSSGGVRFPMALGREDGGADAPVL